MANQPRVLLITMPWQSATVPSIQLGILQSSLLRADVPTDSLYANLAFAEAIGIEQYQSLATGDWYPFVCEWLFNEFMGMPRTVDKCTLVELIDVQANNPITKFAHIKDHNGLTLDPVVEIRRDWTLHGTTMPAIDYFHHLKFRVIPEVYESLFSRVNFSAYSLIAFTCAYSQLVPSLSFAQEIKKRFPGCQIAMGGSAVHGETGKSLLGFFPDIDYVCDGDGEEAIVAMALGSFTNNSGPHPYPLENSPTPNYDDYFEQVRALESRNAAFAPIHDGSIPYETSRGCILAIRRPCAFCALNGALPNTSRKSIEKILSDIDELEQRYAPTGIALTDNLVNIRAQRKLFEELRDRGPLSEIFLETTPNLTRRELILAKEAGVIGIQAGVEALSTPLLKLLGKRNSLAQTLRFLRDCSEVGIAAHYNFLIGIPGETSEHYQMVLELIPSLTDVRPPAVPLTPISLQKHSPYWSAPNHYGIENIRPAKQYSHIYPPSMVADLAFFFDFDIRLPGDFDPGYLNELIDAVAKWNSEFYASASRDGEEAEIVGVHLREERRSHHDCLTISLEGGSKRL